jgi:hypothetical protein
LDDALDLGAAFAFGLIGSSSESLAAFAFAFEAALVGAVLTGAATVYTACQSYVGELFCITHSRHPSHPAPLLAPL